MRPGDIRSDGAAFAGHALVGKVWSATRLVRSLKAFMTGLPVKVQSGGFASPDHGSLQSQPTCRARPCRA
ncbi:hypothetical protein MES4922_210024 [Mesorhizobium ventifaucium]|uniref:Uncharacterized protein n=1 Tax=Mesorhizobium ventifaucium TaxID=666020 RepID=A0ABN8JPM1_9HYPH|nr:hypothetical protein MES4922_210024 [Mesorhizobium ventifaucium]